MGEKKRARKRGGEEKEWAEDRTAREGNRERKVGRNRRRHI